MQSVALSLYLSLRRPSVMFALLRAWKPSLFAGFMGALASQFWFLAFALATAASVRTLALIEVLFAQMVARYGFGQRTSAREAIGMALVVAGVGYSPTINNVDLHARTILPITDRVGLQLAVEHNSINFDTRGTVGLRFTW